MMLLVFTLFSGTHVKAQDTAANKPASPAVAKELHSPHKATIYAMVLPGLGQAYNHKYWKIPVVYAGFGTLIYFLHINTKNYNEFKDAYQYVSATKKIIYPPTPVNQFSLPDPPNDWAKKYTEDQLKEGRDFYRRNLEVTYIFTGVWYILSVVDAVVDAHFFNYDINDDLTLKVTPWIPTIGANTAYGISGGINMTMRF